MLSHPLASLKRDLLSRIETRYLMNIRDRFPDAVDITSEVKVVDPVPVFVGNYSFVLKGLYRNEFVAIKVLRLVKDTRLPVMRRKVRREGAIWATLRHPNITPLYGYIENESLGPFGAFVSPWYTHGDAAAALRMYGMALECTDERVQLWIGIISGVQYLHNQDPPIIHGDLKLSNVLLNDHCVPLLCDFGLARIAVENGCSGLTTTSDHTGTIRYLAPELALSDGKCSPTIQSDIYALGCIGLEVVFGQSPYATEEHPRRITENIKQGIPPAYRPGNLNLASSAIWTVLENCWQLDPNERPGAGDLLHYTQDISACIRNPQPKPQSPQELSPLLERNEEMKEELSSLPESTQGYSVQFSSRKPINQEQYTSVGKQSIAPATLSVKASKLRPPLIIKSSQNIEGDTLSGVDSRARPDAIPVVSVDGTTIHNSFPPPTPNQMQSFNPKYTSVEDERASVDTLNSRQQRQQTAVAPTLYVGSDFINPEKTIPEHNVLKTLRGALGRKTLLGKGPTKYISSNVKNPQEKAEFTSVSEWDNSISMSDKSILALPPHLRIFHPSSQKAKFFSGSKGSDVGSDSATNVSDRRSFARTFKRPSRHSSVASSGSSRSAISSTGSSSVSSPSIISIVSSIDLDAAEDTMNEYIIPRLLPSNHTRRPRQGIV